MIKFTYYEGLLILFCHILAFNYFTKICLLVRENN
jgi:hypothetical protein